jgi:hypothetical protein
VTVFPGHFIILRASNGPFRRNVSVARKPFVGAAFRNTCDRLAENRLARTTSLASKSRNGLQKGRGPLLKPVTMNSHSITSQPISPIPADSLTRDLAIVRPEKEQSLPHLGVVGDTYTVLLSGDDTDGRYCLIDMVVPPGGGPPPHRHDF